MSDTLRIFGKTYNNATGIKAQDANGNTLVFTRGNSVVVSDSSNATGTTANVTTNNAVVLGQKTVTESGTYDPSDEDLDGYSEVVVDVNYNSSRTILLNNTLIYNASGQTLNEVANSSANSSIETIVVTGTLGTNADMNSGQAIDAWESSFPNLKRLIIKPTAMTNGNNYFKFGHYAFNGLPNLEYLELGSKNGIYFDWAGYYQHTSTLYVGSDVGLEIVVYRPSYASQGGFSYGKVAPSTKLIQINYQTGEVMRGGDVLWTSSGLANGTEPSGDVTISAIDTVAYGLAFRPAITSVTYNGTDEWFGNYLFSGCTSMTRFYAPNMTSMRTSIYGITQYPFQNCSALTDFDAPNFADVLPNYCFKGCSSLVTIDLAYCTKIQTSFNECTALRNIILRSSSVCTLADYGVAALSGIYNNPTESTIYVPSELISSYQTATNWALAYEAGVTFTAIEGSDYE